MPIPDHNARQVSRETIVLLRDLVHLKTGIFFDEQWLDIFIEKISSVSTNGGGTMMDFYYRLKYDDDGKAWDGVIDALSVQETYFWREMNQVNALVESIVPEWFRRSSRPFRIWSAACATGEEPITIAIALREAGWGDAPIEIVASDASSNAVSRSRLGIYRERSFRSLPPALREKYFQPAAEGWKVIPEIQSRISIHRANLVVRADVENLARANVIFCRNVFIYFSRDSIVRALAHFKEGLAPDGHLFVGVSESLLNLTDQFTLREIGDASVYLPRRVES